MNKDTKITFFGVEKIYGFDENSIKKQIIKKLLSPSETAYSDAKVKVKSVKRDQLPYIVITLLHKDTYTAETVKANIDDKNQITDIVRNYKETPEDITDEFEEDEEGGYGEKTLVFATPCNNYPTAVSAVNYLYDIAKENGYTAIKLIGEQATTSEYKKYMKSNIIAFVNIGHGLAHPTDPRCDGIVCYDANIYYDWFEVQDISDEEVIYFNSCKAFQPPLGTAIQKSSPRTYISGLVNLPVGASEECCKLFWDQVLPQNSTIPMGKALNIAQQEFTPEQMDIWGDTEYFSSNS